MTCDQPSDASVIDEPATIWPHISAVYLARLLGTLVLWPGITLGTDAQTGSPALKEVVVPAGPTIRLYDGREIAAHVIGLDDQQATLSMPSGEPQRISSEAIAEVRFATITGATMAGQLVAWDDGIYDLQNEDGLIRVFSTFVPPTDASVVARQTDKTRAAATHAVVGVADQASAVAPSAQDTAVAGTALQAGPKIEVSAETVSEAQSPTVFEVRLSEPAPHSVALIYATIDGSAKAGRDYQPQRGVLMLDAGTTMGEIRTPLIDDQDVETEEEFELFVSVDPKRATLQTRQTRATILDDDGAATQ